MIRNIHIVRTNIVIDDNLMAAALAGASECNETRRGRRRFEVGGSGASSKESTFVTRKTSVVWRPREHATRLAFLSKATFSQASTCNMVLADTSVWIDYFNGIVNWQTDRLD